jgi:hypothetical protein
MPKKKSIMKLPTRFDDYEIHGVREFDGGDGHGKYCERVDDNEAQFWSLFGHIPGQGLDCIGDFKTRQLAEEVFARITGRRYTGRGSEAMTYDNKTKDSMISDQNMKEDDKTLGDLLTHLDNTRLALPEFGSFIALSEDREAIFVCAMNSDGTPELEPNGHLNWTYVTAPDEEFIDRVNTIYGTAFDWSKFAGR